MDDPLRAAGEQVRWSMRQPSRESIERVLTFLPYFVENRDTTVCVSDSADWFDPCELAPEVYAWIQTLYDEGFVQSFDWPERQNEAKRFFEVPGRLGASDIATIQKLLTTHVRKDRFFAGHLADMIESGHILAILQRLQEIFRVMKGNTAVGPSGSDN